VFKKEVPPKKDRPIYDIKTLSPHSKMIRVLEIFDLGPDKEKNEERKAAFIRLLGQYHESFVRSQVARSAQDVKENSSVGSFEISDEGKKKLHDQIMEAIRNASLSRGLSPEQRSLLEYLAQRRDEVEKMITAYFRSDIQSDPNRDHIIQQARQGGGWFVSPPDKEKD
jgi:hypothetical protein